MGTFINNLVTNTFTAKGEGAEEESGIQIEWGEGAWTISINGVDKDDKLEWYPESDVYQMEDEDGTTYTLSMKDGNAYLKIVLANGSEENEKIKEEDLPKWNVWTFEKTPYVLTWDEEETQETTIVE